MKIRHIDIKHFRGIQTLSWTVPEGGIVCLIGRGDSTKSTILDAIRYALFPAWNPSFNEFDFFQTDTSSDVEITITLGELPEDLLSDNKYGLYLRGWDSSKKCAVDEPEDGLEEVITVRLIVDQDLEPKWTVICERFEEGKPFRVSDRAKACATYIGAYADSHLTWNKNSALSRITESENILGLLSEASRAAKEALNADRHEKLASFDSAANVAEGIAKKFGVPVSGDGAYKAQLDTGAINIRAGGLSLHDQNIPLRRLGLGSRRMLTFGIQQEGLSEPHITLIDEIEIGLEPHRISRLLKKLNEDDGGQYFITTHSPVVLRELTVEQLSVVQIQSGQVTVKGAAIAGIKDNIQGKIRKDAGAFLAKKVIVCEGATEVGLCRGLDNHWTVQGNDPFSFHGVAMFDAGGGSQIRNTAEAIISLGYEVLVIGDSDDSSFSASDETDLVNLGAQVTRWEGDLSIEEYFFNNLSWETVLSSVRYAYSIYSDQSVIAQVRNDFPSAADDVAEWTDSEALRTAIGSAAKRKSWFKRQDRAEEWVSDIKGSLNDGSTPIGAHIESIKAWVTDA
ncbi:MAG: putative ATP-dependent endonuclease of OLD family [Candidatus Endobugula sp.]|jgi:putative ATP-dependent endonuclease of OLD family